MCFVLFLFLIFFGIVWSAAPFNQKKPLAFCQFNGTVCCNSREDLKLQRQFEAINVSGSCSPFLKSLLCSVRPFYKQKKHKCPSVLAFDGEALCGSITWMLRFCS